MLGDAHNRKLARISQEENWCVVEDPIPVTLVGVELDREATRIPRAIWRTLLASNGGEACNTLRLLANFRQHINRRLNSISKHLGANGLGGIPSPRYHLSTQIRHTHRLLWRARLFQEFVRGQNVPKGRSGD
jgi:hypothetical protein